MTVWIGEHIFLSIPFAEYVVLPFHRSSLKVQVVSRQVSGQVLPNISHISCIRVGEFDTRLRSPVALTQRPSERKFFHVDKDHEWRGVEGVVICVTFHVVFRDKTRDNFNFPLRIFIFLQNVLHRGPSNFNKDAVLSWFYSNFAQIRDAIFIENYEDLSPTGLTISIKMFFSKFQTQQLSTLSVNYTKSATLQLLTF
jgi:hypothetical protein